MPDISKITLPSGTTYDIKDTTAREMISAGVSFIIAWDGASSPVAANIPKGVVVTYNGTSTTGTLEAASAVSGAFYLVKTKTTPSSETYDVYDEYVVIKPATGDSTTWFWEKVGDTKVDLTDVVTGVTLNKQTDSVIGADATFTVTQPTVALSTGATAGTGVVSVVTGISGASASGDTVSALTGLGTPSTTSVIGAGATLTNTQPTVTLVTNPMSATGRVEVLTGASANNTNVKATASGGSTAWNSKDSVSAVTGYENPDTDTFVKTVSSTSKKLVTTSIRGVSGSTTASKATAATSQTTATGTGTSSTTNTDWLKGVSVSNETLTFGAATMNTQTTTQFTFGDVTVPTAASSATTVATGTVADSDTNGATVVTAAGSGTTGTAVTDLGTASTKSVIGASSTFTVTQPTISLATGATAGTGVISLTNGISPSSTYLGATASGGGASWNSKDSKTVVTGYASPTTDDVLGTGSTITVTPSTTNLKATASGANTAWNSKDSVTVLTNATTISVTKGE